MTTSDTIQGYFGSLKQKQGWESFLAEDMVFTSFASPNKQVRGRAAYLEATKRFYAMIISVEVRDLLTDGAKACALTRYELRRPDGVVFVSDVAEIVGVRDGQISSLGIFFDSAPFPK
jgi:ketosteroid isomerase-like protein